MANNKADMTTAFLDAWQALENALRKYHGVASVADFESDLQDSAGPAGAAEKLRICRQARNFIVHCMKDFVVPSKAMVEFLAQMEKIVRETAGTVKDMMESAAKYGSVSLSSTASEAAAMMKAKRRDSLLVLDNERRLAGICGYGTILAAMAEGDPGMTMEALRRKGALIAMLASVRGDTPAADLPDRRVAVVDAKGRCIGVANAGKGW